MSSSSFWGYLAGITIGTVAVLFVIDLLLPVASAFSSFTLLTTGVFAALIGLAYVLAVKSATGKNKYAYVHLVMGLIFVKMIICILLVLFHIKTAQPDNKLFVLPFLFVYLIFTIFEVYVLQKVAQLKPAET